MKHRVIWAGVIATTIGATALFWTVKATVEYKPLLPRGVPRNITRADLEQLKSAAREERTPTARPASRAVVDQTEHNFGMIDPGAAGTRSFVVRNEGLETLRLGDPSLTCTCGTASYSRREIPPGESAEVHLGWSVGEKTGPFSLGLSVPTSDPDHRWIYFRVAGNVRQQLSASPGHFAVGDLSPDSTPSPLEVVVFSQVWESFQIEQLGCDIADATCIATPATSQELQAYGAKSGYRISLTLANNLPSGPLSGRVEFAARPSASETSHPYSMGVVGHVRSRLSIYGSPVSQEGVVELGTLTRLEGKRTRLLVKVRDAQRELPNVRFEIEPSYIQARLTPQGVASGLYALDIEIPNDSPAEARLRPDQWGTLVLHSDHPRIGPQKLRLRYAITEREMASLP